MTTKQAIVEEQGYVVLEPTGASVNDKKKDRKIAERPNTLDGAVIGFVSNPLRLDMQQAIFDEVCRQVEVKGKLQVYKAGISVAPEKEDWDRLLEEVDVAITAYGG